MNHIDTNSIVGTGFTASMAFIGFTEVDQTLKVVSMILAIGVGITTLIYNIKKIKKL